MTLLTKPVRRVTAATYRGRPLVVQLHPRHLEIREQRRRDVLSVDYASIYEFAMKIRFKRLQAEKKASGSGRKRGRA